MPYITKPCSFYTRINMRSALILRKKNEDTVGYLTTMKRKRKRGSIK